VDANYVLSIPENLDVKSVAPLLCAGITMYSPLKHWKVQKGWKVGIVGMGGLGHIGVKLAHALGAHVVIITTTPAKGEDAKRVGADEVLISTDADAIAKHARSFDFIIDTIPVSHDLNPYLALLKNDSTLCVVGSPTPLTFAGMQLIMGRKSVSGSLIGGLKETQEMINFCGKHNITCEVEIVDIQHVNEAYERLQKNDVKYRFVIDIGSLKTGK